MLDDERNPAWEVLRRDVAVSALDPFPTLSVMERRELYGAVTAALWLAGDRAVSAVRTRSSAGRGGRMLLAGADRWPAAALGGRPT